MEALRVKATTRKHVNVLNHLVISSQDFSLLNGPSLKILLPTITTGSYR